MIERLAGFLNGRAPRERGLLALLAGVVLPIAVILIWVLPQIAARAALNQQLSEAQDLQVWVAERVAEKVALDAALPEVIAGPLAAIGISGIEQSLIAAGLRDVVTRLANREGGGVDLGFEAVEFSALSDWLDRSTPIWGYKIDAFRLEATDRAGSVAASLLLEVAQ
jgi:general secretion pathway protein M